MGAPAAILPRTFMTLPAIPPPTTPTSTPSRNLAAFGFHRADGLAEIFGRGRRVSHAAGYWRADVQRDDIGPLARQPHRVRPSLGAGGAGDKCHPAVQ